METLCSVVDLGTLVFGLRFFVRKAMRAFFLASLMFEVSLEGSCCVLEKLDRISWLIAAAGDGCMDPSMHVPHYFLNPYFSA